MTFVDGGTPLNAATLNALANPSVTISGTAEGTASISLDGVTVENGSSGLQIKDGGVGTTKLAATSVMAAKLGSDVAGDGLTGGNGSPLAVNVDAVTLEIDTDVVRVKDYGVKLVKLTGTAADAKPTPTTSDSVALIDVADGNKVKAATLAAVATALSGATGSVKAKIGTYSGSTLAVTVEIGFQADIVLVMDQVLNGAWMAWRQETIPKWHELTNFDSIGSNGASFGASNFAVPGNVTNLNKSGRIYNYIALKVA
jgi:hypothetical protein